MARQTHTEYPKERDKVTLLFFIEGVGIDIHKSNSHGDIQGREEQATLGTKGYLFG